MKLFTLISRLGSKRDVESGFALPTILIASIVMLIVLLTSVSATSSVRVALDEQYYTKLAQQAAEAGQARADACLELNNYAAGTWDDSRKLRPDTNCNGIYDSSLNGGNRYIVNSGNVRTTFLVSAPVIGTSSSATVTVVGMTELLRTSTGSVHDTYTHTLVQQSRYVGAPKIAGGGGWKGARHIAAVLSTDQKLYGFGANDSGQINNTSSPTSVLTPVSMDLPAGVSYATELVTAGQGGSIICIKSNTAQIWCRGAPAGGEPSSLMPTSPAGWHRFALPTSPTALTAVSMSISGYGPDSMCVLASDGQAYCAGENFYGSLGINDASYRIIPISAPERFRLDIPAPGQTLRKIHTEGNITCGITVTSATAPQLNNMYCAGRNDGGAIAGPAIATYAAPIRYPIPGARSIDDVTITYHMADEFPVVHVLATDGTIWSSGNYKYGDLGNGLNSGSTGTSQSPSFFTSTSGGVVNEAWATGSELWNGQADKCIDNAGNGSNDGNVIQMYTCNDSVAQKWIHGKNKQLTNIGTGKCLDVPGGNTNPAEVELQLHTCNDSSAQKFDLVGSDTIRHVSGLCVDIRNGSTALGARLILWTCGTGDPISNAAQSFTRWPGINPWRGMIVGVNHFCAVREDNWSGMWCAGRNDHGQLVSDASAYSPGPGGSFAITCAANPGISTPEMGHSIANVNLPNPDGIVGGEEVDYTKLSSEWNRQFLSTMVITKAGNVYGAGRNEFGKLGDGSIGAGPDFRECGTTRFMLPSGVKAVDMSARDEYTTYVLGSDGKIYAAGRNNLGQMGNGSSTTNPNPTPVEVKIPRQATVY